MTDTHAAIVLSGGKAVRLGGKDKGALVVGGTSLLEHALAVTALATETVVVGESAATSRVVTWAREEPAGGGPAAGLFAGLDALAGSPDLVSVIAVDMPGIMSETLTRLTQSLGASDDGAVLVDADGQIQPLCAVYRVEALRHVRPDVTHNRSMKSLLDGLTIKRVEALPGETRDIDTWVDLDSDA